MDFASIERGIDAAIAATLCDSGVVYPASGDEPVAVRLTLDEPIIEDSVSSLRAARTQAVVEVLASDLAVFRDKDEVVIGAGRWRVVGQPTKPADGAWWSAAVSRLGDF